MTEEATQRWWAVYSRQAAPHGTTFYASPDGREVEVTAVYASREEVAANYNWPDIQHLGWVTRWVRPGRKSEIP
jgi:hypothetical protein